MTQSDSSCRKSLIFGLNVIHGQDRRYFSQDIVAGMLKQIDIAFIQIHNLICIDAN